MKEHFWKTWAIQLVKITAMHDQIGVILHRLFVAIVDFFYSEDLNLNDHFSFIKDKTRNLSSLVKSLRAHT